MIRTRASCVSSLFIVLVILSVLLLTGTLFKTQNFDENQHLVSEAFHECRFWAMISPSMPESVAMNQLVYGEQSLKNLGAINYNGWGLAYFNSCEPTVLRGALPANSDPAFDLAAQELAESGSKIGVGHVRRATSGASDIPNPHPFMRLKGGKWWAYGHNGGLSEPALRELIGQEYLDQNPPTVGDNWSDPRVVDSDLYMLYILKCIEENDWNVTAGVAKAIRNITKNAYGTMNFFLTDGETLWGFRLGNTLHYYYNETSPSYAVIASQPPTNNDEGWIELHDYNFIILKMNNPPIIIDKITAVPEFTSLPILSLIMIATLLAAIIYKKTQCRFDGKTIFKCS
ncbi:class II glutamine amidotransferase [Candidatus Bathyarchaeota archaeon]|nr:class II glutamine amidotransferase [Candidatus Bathyarchaeota archaeon]